MKEEIILELTEMKKLGMRVPKKAFELATNEQLIRGIGGMSVSEMADYLISLC